LRQGGVHRKRRVLISGTILSETVWRLFVFKSPER
jgi:hypothetical protein